jgi:hypothetical protein
MNKHEMDQMFRNANARRAAAKAQASGVPIIGDPNNPLNRPAQVRDRHGRVLGVGDAVQVHTPVPPLFLVQRLETVEQPGAPPGLMEVEVFCRLRFHAVRDEQNVEFLRILTAEETQVKAAPLQSENGSGLAEPSTEEPQV